MKPGQAKGSYSKDVQTYIDECNRERRLGRSIEVQTDARPLSWGKCVEKRAFNVLGLEYTLCSNVTLQHPTISHWVGSPDATTKEVVCDLKCPMTLTSFCQLVDPYYENGKLIYEGLTIEAVRENHKDGEKFYWQIVSNAVLTGKDKGELIIYVPYERELEEIKTLADGNPDYYWIWVANNSKLPYLIEGKHYKNVNVIPFDIHKEDKERLTERVLTCGNQLVKL
jgi:hypothetical protein